MTPSRRTTTFTRRRRCSTRSTRRRSWACGLAEQTNQFLADTLEQLIVDNTRKRDAEAVLMNATIYQWRYGLAYGQDLFRNTAADIDSWRLR